MAIAEALSILTVPIELLTIKVKAPNPLVEAAVSAESFNIAAAELLKESAKTVDTTLLRALLNSKVFVPKTTKAVVNTPTSSTKLTIAVAKSVMPLITSESIKLIHSCCIEA